MTNRIIQTFTARLHRYSTNDPHINNIRHYFYILHLCGCMKTGLLLLAGVLRVTWLPELGTSILVVLPDAYFDPSTRMDVEMKNS